MNERWGQWEREYVLLGLRINKVSPGFVDAYFGPAEWSATVAAEPVVPPADLVRAAVALSDALPAQGFPPRRAAYLARQVRALETTCRRLAGEDITLREEVRRCFEVEPERVPEEWFEATLARFDEALPGRGSLADRRAAWEARHEVGPEKAQVMPRLLKATLAEARRRTLAFVDLPEGEEVEVQLVSGQPWSAYARHLGNFRSLIQLNTDMPTDVTELVNTACHEGYPGHHTESAVKEHLLYRGHGWVEHAIVVYNTPQCVVSEGIAMLAEDVVFAPGEGQRWLAERVYPEVGVEAEPADETVARLVDDLFWASRTNAVFMLHEEGRSTDEVVRYLMSRTQESEERARRSLGMLTSPLYRTYLFTYSEGRRLIAPLLRGENRLDIFRRLLTEQVYPSLLAEGAWS